MDLRKYHFLEGILGADGACALRKASELSPELGNVLIPRTILAWLATYDRFGKSDYEGELPGVDNTYVSFKRSENNEFSGVINIDDRNYTFQEANVFHLASAIAVALGVDKDEVDPDVRDLDLAKLGKSIDLLAKARLLTKSAAEELDKVESPGGAAKPKAPDAPMAPELPKLQVGGPPASGAVPKLPGQPKAPKQKVMPEAIVPPPKQPKIKLPSVTLKRSEAYGKCGMCGRAQFNGDNFIGCTCFAGMSSDVEVTKKSEGFELKFGKEWDQDSIEAFLETVRKQ